MKKAVVWLRFWGVLPVFRVKVKALRGVLVGLIGCKQRLFEGLESEACGQVGEAVDAFLGCIVGIESVFGGL